MTEALSRRLGLQNRVTFHGFVSRTEIARHYQAASVALVSSVWPEMDWGGVTEETGEVMPTELNTDAGTVVSSVVTAELVG